MGLCAEDWNDHLEWLLGPDVFKLIIKTADHKQEYRASWLTVLELELHVRKHAMWLVTKKRYSLKQALVAAREDEKLVNRHFQILYGMTAGVEAAAKAASLGVPAAASAVRTRAVSTHSFIVVVLRHFNSSTCLGLFVLALESEFQGGAGA